MSISRIAGRANTMGHRFGRTNWGTAHFKPATTATETTPVASVIRTSDTGLMMRFSCDHNCRVYAQRGTYHVSLGFAVASLLLRCLICPQNVSHQRAGARCVDLRTGPTADSVACDCSATVTAAPATQCRVSQDFDLLTGQVDLPIRSISSRSIPRNDLSNPIGRLRLDRTSKGIRRHCCQTRK